MGKERRGNLGCVSNLGDIFAPGLQTVHGMKSEISVTGVSDYYELNCVPRFPIL